MSSPNPKLVKALGRLFVGGGLFALVAGLYVVMSGWGAHTDADQAKQAMASGITYLGGILALAGAIGCGIGWFVLKALDKQAK